MSTQNRRLRVRPAPPVVEKQQARAYVSTKMIHKQDEAHAEEYEENLLEETFTQDDPPATVRFGNGLTINLGNYESLRVDVAVTIPCHRNRIDEALEYAMDVVTEKLEQEQASWTGTGKKKG